MQSKISFMAATITGLFIKVQFLIVLVLVNFQFLTTSAWPLSSPDSIWYKPLNKQEVQQITSATLVNATDSVLIDMTSDSSGWHGITAWNHAKVPVIKRNTSPSIHCEVPGSRKDVFVPGYGNLTTRTCLKYASHGRDCFGTRKKACIKNTTFYKGSDNNTYSIDYCTCAPPPGK